MLFSSRVVSKRVGLPIALSEGRLKRLNILRVYENECPGRNAQRAFRSRLKDKYIEVTAVLCREG